VARLGRNDPCPCGSGKKYKNCCLKKDRAKRIRESAWRREEQVTLDKLIIFAQRPALSAQLVVAFNMFWNGNYGIEGWNALDRDEIGRFLDWYVQDYRLEQSRKRVIDLFIEEMGSKLLAGELDRVRSWSDSYMSAYRIAGPAEQGLLPVADVFQGTEESVGDDGLGQLSLPGDLVVGRVLHSSTPPHFSWAAILLPAAMEAELVAFIIKAHGQYQEAHAQASWPGFLSDAGYMFNHHLLLSAAEEAGGRRAAGAYYDASGTVGKLREAERRLRERAAREAEERRKEEQPPAQEEVEPMRQTQGGILLPGHVQYKGSKELKR
jgi:hypothetical protein